MHTPLKDPDLVYFAGKLRHTEEGAKYLRLWDALNIARNELREALACPKFERLVPKLRNRVIHLDNQCSSEIANLESMYNWPPG